MSKKLSPVQKKFLDELTIAMQNDNDLSVFRAINMACGAINPTLFSKKDTNFSDIATALEKYNRIRGL